MSIGTVIIPNKITTSGTFTKVAITGSWNLQTGLSNLWYNILMISPLTTAVKASLWSYDTEKLDLVRDKNRIIKQTLNHGSLDAILWLKANYHQSDLVAVFEGSSTGEWTKKSLNYWSIILDTKPKRTNRFS